ncbi:PAS domain S-box protein [Singulisphaera sp. PoT]|uniref:PAS domain S-box protein n=1 Tax=Singulisphaera sp. PoT TaxID=3411797 RepID=UPI003BF47941
MSDPSTIQESTRRTGNGPHSREEPLPEAGDGSMLERWARITARALESPLVLVSLINDQELTLKAAVERADAWTAEAESGPAIDVKAIKADPLGHLILRASRTLAIADVQAPGPDFDAEIIDTRGGWSAYLGVPLGSPEGEPLGVLSVLEPRPRDWSPHDIELLRDLGEALVVEWLAREGAEPDEEFRPTLPPPLESRWLDLIDTLPDPAWICDAGGRPEAFNRSWLEYTGLGRARSLELGWAQAIEAEDRPRVSDAWDQALASGRKFEFPCRLLNCDGSTRWFLLRNTPRHGSDGRIEAWLGTATDIQAHKETEQALRHQRELLDTISRTATEGLCLLDLKGRVSFTNPAFEQIFGWTGAELENRRLEDLVAPGLDRNPPQGPPEIWAPQSVLESAVIIRQREANWRRKDGQSVMVSFSCSPLLREGELVGAVLSVDDITERKQSSQALVINRERLDLVIRSTELGLWYGDLPLNRLRWNPKCKEHFGLPQDSQVSFDLFYELLHPEDRERTREAVSRAIETRETFDIEYRTLGPDGKVRWIRAIGKATHDPSGRPARFDGITVDMTERKQAEDALRAAKETAESASRAKDQFIAALSHELRTPLTPVLVNVTAMLEDSETPDMIRPTLEIARRNIALEARLIDDLLDVTRISQGKLRIRRESVDAHELVGRALEICRDEIGTAGLNLELRLEAIENRVEADPARLQQMIWNLIKNAVKFTPKRGLIQIKTRNEPPARREATRPDWVIEVSDTGIGIDVEVLPKIFNAFEQGDPAVTKQFGGLGLGLAISRSLAEAHGGSLAASSSGRNQGATFTLRLPTISPPVRALEPPRPSEDDSSAPLPKLRVLLVEDNPDTLRVMTRLLRSRGYEVAPADCMAAAIEAERTVGPFDLVVSDIGLPDGSGLDVIRHIRSARPVPGIALSGFGTEDDLRKSGEAGFVAHLIKPVDFPTLDAAIRQIAQLARGQQLAGPGPSA